MQRLFLQIVICLSAVGVLEPALAQSSSAWEIGVYGGPIAGKGGSHTSEDEVEITTSIGDGSGGGLNIGYSFAPALTLVMDAGLSTNDHLVDMLVLYYDEGNSIEETTELFFLNCNVLVSLWQDSLAPFITAGAGWIAFVDVASPALNFGCGLTWRISEKVSLRLQARQYRTELDGSIARVYTEYQFGEIYIWEEQIPFKDDLRFQELRAELVMRFP